LQSFRLNKTQRFGAQRKKSENIKNPFSELAENQTEKTKEKREKREREESPGFRTTSPTIDNTKLQCLLFVNFRLLFTFIIAPFTSQFL